MSEFKMITDRKREMDKRNRLTMPERAIVNTEKDYRLFQKNIKVTINRINKASKEIDVMKRKHRILRKNTFLGCHIYFRGF